MTAAQSLYRRFGALELPLQPITPYEVGNLASLDPARDILLDLFAAALNSELEPVWAQAVNGTPLEGSEPVKTKFPGAITAEALGEMKAGWPLLAVSRAPTPALFSDYTLEQRLLTQRWDVDFILCPLAVTSLLRLQDTLQAVGKVVDLCVKERGHRAYRTGTNGNATFAADVIGSGDNCCDFQSLRVVDMALGPASFAQGAPKYWACGLTLESTEISGYPTINGEENDGEAVPLIVATGTFGITQSGDPAVIARG